MRVEVLAKHGRDRLRRRFERRGKHDARQDGALQRASLESRNDKSTINVFIIYGVFSFVLRCIFRGCVSAYES